MTIPKIVIVVPIKSTLSERLPGKNFLPLRGKPLCYHLLGELVKVQQEIKCDIYIDSDSVAIFKQVNNFSFKNHLREKWLADSSANGNHLLSHFAAHRPNYDIYIQAFVTAVNLKAETIIEIIKDFASHIQGSAMIGTYVTGFFWKDHEPVNYDSYSPIGLSRSQDIRIFKESTGLYLIRKNVLNVTGCRLSLEPARYVVSDVEALDVDTSEDLRLAEIYY